MFCKNCGQEINDSAIICPYCGVATNQMPGMYNNAPIPDMYDASKKTNGIGIAGFVVGLVGFLGANFLYLIPGIVALVLSIVGVAQMKKCNSCNGLAVAGLVVSIVSFCLWLVIWIFYIAILIELISNGEIIPEGFEFLNQLSLLK